MSLDEMIGRTKELEAKFPVKGWSPEIRALDLVEEMGELCSAILEYHGHKTVPRTSKEPIVDSLCDILFDVFLLFKHYDIDIESAYNLMLDQLEDRLNRKEWGAK
jgi:NTP pyrophosphatase (non-canonical NTP hydrolase)